MSRLRAVFFDFDGTLHDLRRAHATALARVTAPLCRGGATPAAVWGRCERRWTELWPAFVRGVIGEAALYSGWFVEMLAATGAPATPPAAAELERRYNFELAREIRPYPDVVPALTSLRAQRPALTLGILTNGSARYQRHRIAASGLGALLPLQVISGEEGVGKPDAAFFAAGAAAAGVRQQEAAMVGDAAEADVAGARRAGLTAIWVNRAGDPWPDGLEPAPSAVTTDLAGAVADLVRRSAPT